MSVRSHEEIEELVRTKPGTRKLTVANGGLATLPDALRELKLHKLEIYTNAFAELPPEVRSQTSLRELLVESNAITELPAWLGELKKLTTLEVPRNRLKRLVLTGPTTLEVLNAPWNPIEELDLRGLVNLRRLDLAKTLLEELPSMDAHPHLRELACTMSPLTRLPDLRRCPEIERLTFNGNGLQALPAELATLPKLDMLHIASNAITDWPQRFSESLTSLFINQNKLVELPPAVLTATSLSILRANGNPFTSLPEGLADLPLKFLDLSTTKISEVPHWVAGMDRLETLLLDFTTIENWPDFDPPPKLKRFSATHAPFMKQEAPRKWQKYAR